MGRHHPQEKRIFQAAREIEDEAERTAYLDRACAGDPELKARVEALVEASGAEDGFLEAPALAEQATIRVTTPSEKPGDMIGRYKLLQQIGEGGFGIVYMAEQSEPIRRRVALKIIKLGMDTKEVVARFEAERQALAMMDHPNIARVLDAGATETGRPYFVMELVHGIPITHYCDQNSLSTRERLELFVPVCQAVQHAHQKAIIHRDLKPSNVMVTLHDGKPVPKVIDFGIAKAIDQPLTDRTLFTAYGQFVGTPEYMSPEQATMNGLGVDTRSDVYSLGVLLYELLTGTTPFERGTLRSVAYDEVCRIIREVEPPTPSSRISTMAGGKATEVAERRHTDADGLGRLVRGDLDWIVMKALEKDRTRRYATAEGLRQDIGRHLADQAVEATPPSTVYRLLKFVRRNRAKVVAGLLVAASLLVGLGMASLAAAQAFRQRGRALTAYREKEEEQQRRQQAEEQAQEARGNAQKERQAREVEATARREEERWDLLAEAGRCMNSGGYEEALTDLTNAAAIKHDYATRPGSAGPHR
jgi:serine/threonine protein kinase